MDFCQQHQLQTTSSFVVVYCSSKITYFFQPVGIHFAFKMVSGVRVPEFCMKKNAQPSVTLLKYSLSCIILIHTSCMKELLLLKDVNLSRFPGSIYLPAFVCRMQQMEPLSYFFSCFCWFVCFDEFIVFINPVWAAFFLSTNFKNMNYEQLSFDCIRKLSQLIQQFH